MCGKKKVNMRDKLVKIKNTENNNPLSPKITRFFTLLNKIEKMSPIQHTKNK